MVVMMVAHLEYKLVVMMVAQKAELMVA